VKGDKQKLELMKQWSNSLPLRWYMENL